MDIASALSTPRPRARAVGLLAAAALALVLTPAPALAADDPGGEDPAVEETTDAIEGVDAAEEGGRITMAETPRDRVGLVLLGFLVVITFGAAITMRRQLKGERPQATGEFRWR